MFRKTKIAFRLFAFVSTVALLAIAIAAFAYYELGRVEQVTTFLGGKSQDRVTMIGKVADRVSEFRLNEADILLASNQNELDESHALLDEHLAEINEFFESYPLLIRTDEHRKIFAAFEAEWADYLHDHDRFVSLAQESKESALELYNGLLQLRYAAVNRAADEILDLDIRNAATAAGSSRAILAGANNALIAAAFAAVAMTIIVLLLVRSRISRPLSAITVSLGKLASGDLTIPVPEMDRDDEIGQLAKAFDMFRKTAQRLEQAICQAEAAQQLAQSLARHDALTGLPNRRVLAEALQRTVARACRGGDIVCAVLIIDLDRFKPVNDLHGHAAGDAVLCEVAARLKTILRSSETLARIGGDEFAAVVEYESGSDAPMRLATRIIKAMSQPIIISDTVVEVGATVGIAVCPGDASEVEELLRAADLAMYRAKREGRGSYRFFEQSMDQELRGRAVLEVELRQAIAADDIRPHYQPLIHLEDNRLLGFEILARWYHPTKGIIQPSVFIPVAEDAGLIPELTYSVLRQACRAARNWPAELTLALNISPTQLKDLWLPQRLLAIMVEEGFAPQRLEVEVTENGLVGDLEKARTILASLRNIGVRISLDDFGTGYSSLYHLRELHFDKIKIDRSFVKSIFENSESDKIVDAIVNLGKSLGLPATAEGIEDVEQLRRLRQLGCENGQGYHFGKAMPADEAEQLIAAHAGELTSVKMAS